MIYAELTSMGTYIYVFVWVDEPIKKGGRMHIAHTTRVRIGA